MVGVDRSLFRFLQRGGLTLLGWAGMIWNWIGFALSVLRRWSIGRYTEYFQGSKVGCVVLVGGENRR